MKHQRRVNLTLSQDATLVFGIFKLRTLFLLFVSLTFSTLALPSYAEFCNFPYSEPIVGEIAVVGQAVDSDRDRFKVLNAFKGKVVEVGGGSGSLNASLVRSYEDILEKTNLTRGGSFGIGPFKLNKSREFIQTITKKKYTATFMLQFDVKLPNEKFEVDASGGTPLTDYARTLLNNSCQFKQIFGDSFVFQTQRGASVYVAINVSFSSVGHLDEYKQNMGGSVEGKFNGLIKTVCTVCGAIPIKIPAFDFKASFDQAKGNTSSSTIEDGKIDVVAMQIGGDASRLGQIFGTGQDVALASCSLSALDNCNKAFNNVLAYLAQEEFATGVKNYPTVLSYLSRPYWEVEPSIQLVKEVTPAVENARNQLAEELLNRETDLSTLKDWLASSQTVAAHRQDLTALQPKLEQDIQKLFTAGFTCFSDLASCENLSAQVLGNLTVYNKSVLQFYLEDGMVAYYPFDGDALDKSGNANNGTVYGATLTTDRFGKENSAYKFNGKSRIQIPYNGSSQLFNNTTEFTYSLWIASNSDGPLMDRDLCDAAWPSIELSGGTSFVSLALNYTNANTHTYFRKSLVIPKTEWTHIAVSYDKNSASVGIYVNGKNILSGTYAHNIWKATTPLYIGGVPRPHEQCWAKYFTGNMDDIRIYNRALTDEEIQRLYTGNIATNQLPTAQFTATPTQGKVPLIVNVDASNSSDPDGSIQSYQWTSSDGQTATGKITSLIFSQAGTYTLTLAVTDDKGGTVTAQQTVTVQSDTVTPPITTSQAHLVNISTRAYTSTGLSSVIAGFIIQGTGACTVMVRGFGKGISISPLLDTQLLLQTYPDGRVLATNQSWATGNDINQIPPGLHLPDSSDAGILTKLSAGAYTATMTPESVVGVGLIGVDQVSCDANTQLVNISTRAEVRDNLEVVIAGFIIDGSGTLKIMLQGFGAGIGLSPCLDTNLRLDKFPASGDSIAVNDNWETATNATLIPAALKLPNNTDAGILVDLPAGAYTATMTHTTGSCTGIGLIGVNVVQ